MRQRLTPTARTQVHRHGERAVYDLEQIYAILDEGFVCNLGFVVDGQPYVIPTAYGRAGNQIYLHGSATSRMVRSLAAGIRVCATVTLVDGLVLARCAFRHSLNYRSVVILGEATLVTDHAQKMEALRCFMNHLVPGRWEDVRRPNQTELMTTSVLSLPLDEVSAKVRSGPPMDLEDDYSVPVWAGVVPIRAHVGEPLPDCHLLPGVAGVDRGRFDRSHHADASPPRLGVLRLP